jgi:hypothetical protein
VLRVGESTGTGAGRGERQEGVPEAANRESPGRQRLRAAVGAEEFIRLELQVHLVTGS